MDIKEEITFMQKLKTWYNLSIFNEILVRSQVEWVYVCNSSLLWIYKLRKKRLTPPYEFCVQIRTIFCHHSCVLCMGKRQKMYIFGQSFNAIILTASYLSLSISLSLSLCLSSLSSLFGLRCSCNVDNFIILVRKDTLQIISIIVL